MPTKRFPITRELRPQITPEVVELFRRGANIVNSGLHEIWEENGGRRNEFFEIDEKLATALNRLLPWKLSPLEVDGLSPDPKSTPEYFEEWQEALALRREIEAMAS